MITFKKLVDVISDGEDSLANNGRMFTNEKQFQFELAILLKEKLNSNVEVVLEKLVSNLDDNNKKCYVDIVVFCKDECVPIELKYKTTSKKIEYVHSSGYSITTANQGACDIGCYDFLKDVKRIERIVNGTEIIEYKGKAYSAQKGFSIMLTNEKNYYCPIEKLKGAKLDGNGYYYHLYKGEKKYYYWQNFSLTNGKNSRKVYKWLSARTGKELKEGENTTDDRKTAIELSFKEPYVFNWIDYCPNGYQPSTYPFKYLIVEVKEDNLV